MTQEQLAVFLGVTLQAISRLCVGELVWSDGNKNELIFEIFFNAVGAKALTVFMENF